jgi:hypothetical protein
MLANHACGGSVKIDVKGDVRLTASIPGSRRGLIRVWGAPDRRRAGDDLYSGQRRQSKAQGAAVGVAKGHVSIVLLLFSALVACLTRSQSQIQSMRNPNIDPQELTLKISRFMGLMAPKKS